MTRNDIKALFPDATKEAIDQLLDINSSDVGKAMSREKSAQEQLEGQVSRLNEQVKGLNEQIGTLNGQVKTLTADVATRDATIKSLTDEKDSAVSGIKAQHEVDIKTLNDTHTSEIKKLSDQLKAAQEKAGIADTLTERVAQLTRDIADRDATIATNNKAYKIKDELRGQHARNVDVVWPLLDLTKITEEDGKLSGLSEQIEALKASDAYLFDVNPGAQRGGFAASPDIGNPTSANDVVNKAIRQLSGHN